MADVIKSYGKMPQSSELLKGYQYYQCKKCDCNWFSVEEAFGFKKSPCGINDYIYFERITRRIYHCRKCGEIHSQEELREGEVKT